MDLSSPVVGSDGTIYIGSYDNNLYAVKPGGTLKWAFNTTGSIYASSPALGADGTIYVGSWDDNLYAITDNGTFGSQKWLFHTNKSVWSSPAVATDGTIYVASFDGNLYAINPANGQPNWTSRIGSGYANQSSPAIGADGSIYLGSNDGNLYAFQSNGLSEWTAPNLDVSISSPAVGADGTIYIGSENGTLYAIFPNGIVRGMYTTGGLIHSAPALGADGTLYVSSEDGSLYALTSGPVRGDWWMFHHDPQHTGLSPFTGPASPVQKWAANINNTVPWNNWLYTSSPALALDGTIYVGSDDDNLYALNPDGTQQWAFPTGWEVTSSPAIGTDGTLYVGSWDGNLYAINPDSTLKWAFATGQGAGTFDWITSSPVIGSDGTIYVGSDDYNLYALTDNGTFCTEKWTFPTGYEINSSPALATDGTIYVGSGDGYLYAITDNGASYSQDWAFSTGGWVNSSPAVGSDGTIYVGSDNGVLSAVNPADGSPQWQFSTYSTLRSSPALGADGTIYIGDYNGIVHAVYPGVAYPGGTEKWEYPTGSEIDSSPAIDANGTIYIATDYLATAMNDLFAFNSDGSLLWSCSIGDNNGIQSSPVLSADGTLYLNADDNNLYALMQSAPAQLQFTTQPTGTLITTVISPPVTVQVQDASGNLELSASTPVTLALGINPGGANLGGTLTVNAVNGVATFSDLTLDQPGVGYTLVATANLLTSATSQPFTITVPPPVITGFTPSSAGPGMTVTITGSYFTGATAVQFGGTDAATFTVLSDNSITATVGNGALGAVTVTTPGGTATSAATFTFIPQLTGVTLSANLPAPQLTGTAITLTATALGIGITTVNVQYQFVAQYKLAGGAWSSNILIQAWSTNSQCTWTPTTAENYAVSVYARPVGTSRAGRDDLYQLQHPAGQPHRGDARGHSAGAAGHRDGDYPHRDRARRDNRPQCPVSIRGQVQISRWRLVAGYPDSGLEHQ